MLADPNLCVASRQKVLCAYWQYEGKVYRIVAPAVVIAELVGLKWETVKKRRLRGSSWAESFLPVRSVRLEHSSQGHSIRSLPCTERSPRCQTMPHCMT